MVTSTIHEQAIRSAVLEALTGSTGSFGIGITTDTGVVTLSGAVTTIEAKFASEEAVRRIKGVRAVANDLAVWQSGISPGTELARTIVAALSESALDPDGRIIVGVQGGWVDLAGEIADDERRQAVVKLIGRLPGVKGVVDELSLRPVPIDNEQSVVSVVTSHLCDRQSEPAIAAD